VPFVAPQWTGWIIVSLCSEQLLAFVFNLYNMLCVHAVCELGAYQQLNSDNPMARHQFFATACYTVGEHTLSLDGMYDRCSASQQYRLCCLASLSVFVCHLFFRPHTHSFDLDFALRLFGHLLILFVHLISFIRAELQHGILRSNSLCSVTGKPYAIIRI
jgi:hypothetical protein